MLTGLALLLLLLSTKAMEKAKYRLRVRYGHTRKVGAITGAILGIRLGEEALPDFYIECLEPAEVLRELADDMHTGCPMEMGNKLFDLDWDYKYLNGGQ